MKAKEMIQKHSRNNGDYIPDYQFKGLEEAIIEYAKERCREQREICASEADYYYDTMRDEYGFEEHCSFIDRDSIKKAPEPEML